MQEVEPAVQVLLGDGARKELWRIVDVGAVSPCAW
jgi:hypothetical protein